MSILKNIEEKGIIKTRSEKPLKLTLVCIVDNECSIILPRMCVSMNKFKDENCL